jgi:hypothetical protein
MTAALGSMTTSPSAGADMYSWSCTRVLLLYCCRYVARKMQLRREMYFAILLDRKTAGPVMIGCR